MACHNFYMSFATGPMLLHELPWVLLACGPSFSSYSIMLLSLVYHLHTQFAILAFLRAACISFFHTNKGLEAMAQRHYVRSTQRRQPVSIEAARETIVNQEQ